LEDEELREDGLEEDEWIGHFSVIWKERQVWTLSDERVECTMAMQKWFGYFEEVGNSICIGTNEVDIGLWPHLNHFELKFDHEIGIECRYPVSFRTVGDSDWISAFMTLKN
jgi:hypothetical protein